MSKVKVLESQKDRTKNNVSLTLVTETIKQEAFQSHPDLNLEKTMALMNNWMQ